MPTSWLSQLWSGGAFPPRSGIELPLLNAQSVSGSGRGDGEEGAAVAEAKALVARQRLLFEAGVVLYVGGFLIDGGSQYWLYHGNRAASARDQRIYGGWIAAYAVAQTGGLLLIGFANVDADVHLQRRPTLAAGVAVAIVAYSCFNFLADGTDKTDLVSE